MTTAIVPRKKTGYVTLILPHLYLGDIETSQDKDVLHGLQITHIINLSNSQDNYHEWDLSQASPENISVGHSPTVDNICYTTIQIEDAKTANIAVHFDHCIKVIDAHINCNKNILVHCVCGVSRSVSIILSYLMYKKYTLKDAFHHVKQLRTQQYTLPNIGFFKQLIAYELQQFGENSMTMNDYIAMRNNN
jgi:protein-tyrosine phosphatase